MVLTLATPQDAISATYTEPRITVYIGGVLTDIISFDSQHAISQTATARLTMPLHREEHVVAGAEVEVQAGHNNLVGTIFSGYLPLYEMDLSTQGGVLTARAVGWSGKLAETRREDIVIQGPIGLDAVFVALCQMMGVPSYVADATTYIDGVTPIMLGGNPQHEDGKVTIKAGQSPLSQLQRLANDYGYSVFDAPDGSVILRRVSGLPVRDPVVIFDEGWSLFSVKGTHDIREVVNYWDVVGVTYDDQYGGKVPIRSRPSSVTPSPLIPGDGIRYKRLQSSDIVRQDQADEIRRVLAINSSAPYTPVAGRAIGLPNISPGDVIGVESDSVEATGSYWLTHLDQSFTRTGGFTGSYDGWAGSGIALPSLNERFTIPIQSGPVHLGDENVPWYAVPSPSGTSQQWPFTLPVNVSIANVRGWAHSWNAQRIGGVETSLDVSRWEIWEAGVDQNDKANRPKSHGGMPQQTEDYDLRLPYSRFATRTEDDGTVVVTDPGHWKPFAINLRSIDAGDYVLKFVCGDKAGVDDGEVRLVELELFGHVEPATTETTP